MADETSLVLSVDSAPVDQANQSLDQLTEKSQAAADTAVQLAGAWQRMTAAQGDLNRAIQDSIRDAVEHGKAIDSSVTATQAVTDAIKTYEDATRSYMSTAQAARDRTTEVAQAHTTAGEAATRAGEAVGKAGEAHEHASASASLLSQALSGIAQTAGSIVPAASGAASTLARLGEAALVGGAAGAGFALGEGIVEVLKEIPAQVTESVQAFEVFQRQQVVLQQVIRATGGAAGESVADINRMAEEIGNPTAVRQAAAELLTFRSVSGDTFKQALELSSDLATVGFGSVQSAARQLGRALEDPARGLDSLRRAGVTFSASERQVIESLVQTGHAAEAQQVILDRLEDTVGGANKAVTDNTLTGSYRKLLDAQERMHERWGEIISDTLHLKGVIDTITSGIKGITPGDALTPTQVAQQRLSDVNNQIDQLYTTGRTSRFGTEEQAQAAAQARLKDLQNQRSTLQQQIQQLQTEAHRESEATDSHVAEVQAQQARADFEATTSSLEHQIELRKQIESFGYDEVINQRLLNDLKNAQIDITKEQGQEDLKRLAALEEEIARTKELADYRKAATATAISALTARSPEELQSVAAQRVIDEALKQGRHGMNEMTAEERDRAEQAGQIALAQAQQQLIDAGDARVRSASSNAQALNAEIAAIGRSDSEAARIRADQQTHIELLNEAYEHHLVIAGQIDERYRSQYENQEKNLQAIHAQEAELQKIEQRLTVINDTKFQRDQLFRSPEEADIVQQLRPIYGNDAVAAANSFEAAQIRINNRLKEFHDLSSSAAKTFLDDIRHGGSLLDALGDAATKALDNITQKLSDELADQFATSLTQAFSGNLSGGAGAGGFIGDLVRTAFGIDKPVADPSKSLVQQAQAIQASLVTMQAGNVFITPTGATLPSFGGVQPGLSAPGGASSITSAIGGLFSPSYNARETAPYAGAVTSAVGGLFSSSYNAREAPAYYGAPNAPSVPFNAPRLSPVSPAATMLQGVGTMLPSPGSIIPGSAAGLSSMGTGGYQQQFWNFWRAQGLKDYQIAGLAGNAQIESAFNPNAVGDAGHAFGIFQWNDRLPALRSYTGARNPTFMQQMQFARHEFATTEQSSWAQLMGSRNVNEATMAGLAFERPKGWGTAGGVPSQGLRLDAANDSLKEFGNSIEQVQTSATQARPPTASLAQSATGLVQPMQAAASGAQNFGSGISSLANQLTNSLSGLGGGGGGFGGILSGLMGGFSFGGIGTPGMGTRASGGEVEPGHSFVVGEKHPEIFVPKEPGTIVAQTNQFPTSMLDSIDFNKESRDHAARFPIPPPSETPWIDRNKESRARSAYIMPPQPGLSNTAPPSAPAPVSNTTVNITPPSGFMARKTEDKDAQGNKRINVTFDEMVAEAINKPGTRTSRALRDRKLPITLTPRA